MEGGLTCCWRAAQDDELSAHDTWGDYTLEGRPLPLRGAVVLVKD